MFYYAKNFLFSFVRQRKTFRHWLQYVRYKKLFGIDNISDSDSNETKQDTTATEILKVETEPIGSMSALNFTSHTNFDVPNVTSSEISIQVSKSHDLSETVSTSNCNSSTRSINNSVTTSPVSSSSPFRVLSDNNVPLNSDLNENCQTRDDLSADGMSDPIVQEQIPTPPLSSSPNSEPGNPLQSSEASVVFILTDCSTPSSQSKTDRPSIDEKVDATDVVVSSDQQISSSHSLDNVKSDDVSLSTQDENEVTDASDNNELSEDEIPLSQLSLDTARRPKRVNAASRYKAIINQLSPSLTSIEPIKKRLRMFRKQKDAAHDTNQAVGPRRSVRLRLRKIESNKSKKVSQKRNRKKVK